MRPTLRCSHRTAQQVRACCRGSLPSRFMRRIFYDGSANTFVRSAAHRVGNMVDGVSTADGFPCIAGCARRTAKSYPCLTDVTGSRWKRSSIFVVASKGSSLDVSHTTTCKRPGYMVVPAPIAPHRSVRANKCFIYAGQSVAQVLGRTLW